MAVPTDLGDLSTTAASNSPSGSDPIGTDLDNYLRAIQAIVKQEASIGSNIASAATITIPDAGSYFIVTGTTGITAINDAWNGRTVILKFSGALTLTNSAGLILPGGANITTAAGDVLMTTNESAGVWRVVHYLDASSDVYNSDSVDIDGGAIDGTTIGGSTPAAISATTLSATGAVTLTGSTVTGGTGSSSHTYQHGSATGATYVSGGSSSDNGGNIRMFGGSHATLAGDVQIRSGTTNVLGWDQSGSTWTFTGTLTHATKGNVLHTSQTDNLTVGFTTDVEALGSVTSITPDTTKEFIKTATITGNLTINEVADGDEGGCIIYLTPDVSGPYTVTLGTGCEPIGTIPDLSASTTYECKIIKSGNDLTTVEIVEVG